MSDGNDQRLFLDDYRRYAESTLEPIQRQLKDLLAEWRNPTYWAAYSLSGRQPTPSPIQRVRIRIKRPESALDKILRKPESYPDALTIESLRRMPDTIGARVIVFFLSQLALVDREIRNSQHFELSPAHPPIAFISSTSLTARTRTHSTARKRERLCFDSLFTATQESLDLRKSLL